MRGIAVCCGFNNYEFHPLNRAENDAAILYTKLTESGTFNDAPELIGKGAVFTQRTSADAVLAAFTRAATSAAELVWFSFSGHAIVSGDGELRLLLPDWRRDASEANKRRYSIGAGQIEHVLRSRLASKKFVVVLDTCHSGAFGAHLEDGHDGIVLRRLLAGDICELKHQLETDLGVTPEIDAIPAITPGAARARAGGSRAASYRRPSP